MDTHSLVYLIKKDQICLGYKKRGFGSGYWNGYGGKVEGSETTSQSVIRETEEESGVVIELSSLERVATLNFNFVDGKQLKVGTYLAHEWNGEQSKPKKCAQNGFQLITCL